MTEVLQVLVMVRHGKDEGDERREKWQKGEVFHSAKKREEEDIVPEGEAQSNRAGRWITQNILRKYGLQRFEANFASPAKRSSSSAFAMDLGVPIEDWLIDANLDERDRGAIRGLHPDDHKRLYPASFAQMKADPLHWRPPGGETLLPDVSNRIKRFLGNTAGYKTVLAVAHRDSMYAGMQPLEGLNEQELREFNTDDIHNAQIWWYTSIDPITGEQLPALMWKYSVDPSQPEKSLGWRPLPHIAEQFGYKLAT